VDIDIGTRLLLKVFSRILDEDRAALRPPPRYVLDAGCGAGVIGVCAAVVLAKEGAAGQPLVRAQDRDELARLFTLRNAKKNHVPFSALEAHAEPLLAGPPDARWDLILTNIPAKAGLPVLEDFVRRSAALLNPDGRVVMAAVRTLADFFRERLAADGIELQLEEKSACHRVFVWGRKAPLTADGAGGPLEYGPLKCGAGFLADYPFYVRSAADYVLEDIPLRLQTVYGAPGFDNPGGAGEAAAKLIRRLGADKIAACSRNGSAALIYEPGQGFFPRWLLAFLRQNRIPPPPLVLSGRNILALAAAQHNAETAAAVVPAGGLSLFPAEGRVFDFIAAFPELPPQSPLASEPNQPGALWEALPPLLAPGGVFVAGFSSTDAERFDRKKPAGFTRLGDIKRKGFRALGYSYIGLVR
jgi:precorrin-6B methylase 2